MNSIWIAIKSHSWVSGPVMGPGDMGVITALKCCQFQGPGQNSLSSMGKKNITSHRQVTSIRRQGGNGGISEHVGARLTSITLTLTLEQSPQWLKGQVAAGHACW